MSRARLAVAAVMGVALFASVLFAVAWCVGWEGRIAQPPRPQSPEQFAREVLVATDPKWKEHAPFSTRMRERMRSPALTDAAAAREIESLRADVRIATFSHWAGDRTYVVLFRRWLDEDPTLRAELTRELGLNERAAADPGQSAPADAVIDGLARSQIRLMQRPNRHRGTTTLSPSVLEWVRDDVRVTLKRELCERFLASTTRPAAIGGP